MTIAVDSHAEKMAISASELPGFTNFALRGVKEKVGDIVDTIGRVDGIFATYTRHDLSHVDQMLEMLEWLIPPATRQMMTPVDWLMTTLAVYFHDLGMAITHQEYAERKDNELFLKFSRGVEEDPGAADFRDRIKKIGDPGGEDVERFLYQEFVRENHAYRIRQWITGRIDRRWGNTVRAFTDEICATMENVPPRFREHLGVVCESHHKEDLDDIERYPLSQAYGNGPKLRANVQYSALLLRTADLLHVTNDRTPSIAYRVLGISDPKGVEEWRKQRGTFAVHQLRRQFDPDDPESHVVVVSADFTDERPYFPLSEYLAWAKEELTRVKRWAEKSQQLPDGRDFLFPWHTIRGDILVEGHEPHPMKFELDRGRLLNLLVGHTLYNDATVAVRELLQNAIDAVRYQAYLERRRTAGNVSPVSSAGRVVVRWNTADRVLTVEDNGTGMDLDIINFHLMRVGSSFYDTPRFESENQGFTPISRFGIGVLTCFMISDDIEIVTFRNGIGYRIRMTTATSDYLVKQLEPGHVLLNGLEPHGTRLRLGVRSSINTGERTMLDIIRQWVLLPDCPVSYIEDEKGEEAVGFASAADALKYLCSKRPLEGVEVITLSPHQEGSARYELSVLVHGGITPERSFQSGVASVCIEGIHVDHALPGFGPELGAVLSVRGNRNFRTTVARSSLEEDKEYHRISLLCLGLLFDHVRDEVERIAAQAGRPLSQASTAGRWVARSLRESIRAGHLYAEFNRQLAKLPLVVVEKVERVSDQAKTYRELISFDDLEALGDFWTIESRTVDYLGIISRDLGRELNVNEFVGGLAPGWGDLDVSPLIPDAHSFAALIRERWRIGSINISKRHQRSACRWELRKERKLDPFAGWIEIERDDSLTRTIKHLADISYRGPVEGETFVNINPLDIVHTSRIEGDADEIIAVATRIGYVIAEDSELGVLWSALRDAVVSDKLPGAVARNAMAAMLLIMIAMTYIHVLPGQITRRELAQATAEIWGDYIDQFRALSSDLATSVTLPERLRELLPSSTGWFNASSYWLDWSS